MTLQPLGRAGSLHLQAGSVQAGKKSVLLSTQWPYISENHELFHPILIAFFNQCLFSHSTTYHCQNQESSATFDQMCVIGFYLVATFSNLRKRKQDTKSSFYLYVLRFLILLILKVFFLKGSILFLFLPGVCFCIKMKRTQGRVRQKRYVSNH